MSTAHIYPQIVDQLDRLRRQWRRRKVIEGLLLTAAAVSGVLVATLVADNLLQFDTTGRSLLALGLWTTAALGIATWIVRRAVEDRRDDFFAAMIEQRHPELSNRLINGLQLGRGNDYGSPRLIEAIVRDAATAAAALDPADCLDRRPVKRAWMGVGGTAAVLVLYASFFTPRFANSFLRVVLPWADVPPYTATQIADASVKPGNARVAEGTSVPVEGQLAGKTDVAAQLYLRSEGKPWHSVPMKASEAAGKVTLAATVRQANESFDYYLAAGDGRSRLFHVEVVERPRVARLSLAVQPPEYTGRPAESVSESDGEISGLCGAQVRLELSATKPLSKATLQFDGGPPLALARAGDDRTWQTSFVLWEKGRKTPADAAGRLIEAPARYQVQLVDTDGYHNAEPLWHSIALSKDQAPSVAIVSPGRDLQVRPADAVPLVVRARDDFGLASVRLFYRVNNEPTVRPLAAFAKTGKPATETVDTFTWRLPASGFRPGDVVQYWATAEDRNNITGPGKTDSQRFSLFITTPEQAVAKLAIQLDDYAAALEELIRLQSENRAQTTAGVAMATLVVRQTLLRVKTKALARLMEKNVTPLMTMVKDLDELHAGLMAEAVRLLEAGRDTVDAEKSARLRSDSLPVQDKILAALKAMLARLQRDQQARKRLKKIEKTDKAAHAQIIKALTQMEKDLGKLVKDETQLTDKFEKLPKKNVDELKDESSDLSKEFRAFGEKWGKWAKGKVDDLTKLPTGFVDDFGLRQDAKRIFEEIEKVAQRPKTQKIEVALEDLGASLATKMLEDLELWMADAPDNLKWVQEEPLKELKVPEMPLPDKLEDMIGDLLQKEEEFDQEADDVTSAWGDNLNQAGWGVADGPIASFSAKGKTGNDLPNNSEMTGRSGDGRRGRSSGQMVGNTSRGLEGRKTPARLSAERYEPGQIKQQKDQDPHGATGGGKKAGAGQLGLQGGTPPDFVRDMKRLSERQAVLRERAQQVARRLESVGTTTVRLNQAIALMQSAENDLRDFRYGDAARKRSVAIGKLKAVIEASREGTSVQLSRARDLPAALRDDLLQSSDERYPEGYEPLLKSYYRALSEAEK